MAFRSLLPVAFRGAVASVVSSRLHSGRTAANAKAFAAVATLASTERDGWSSWRPFAEAAGFAAAAVAVAGLTAPQAECTGKRKWGKPREGSSANRMLTRSLQRHLYVHHNLQLIDRVSDYNYVLPQIVWGDGMEEEEE